MLLTDREIYRLAVDVEMISDPYPTSQKVNARGQRAVSYGSSSCGYDMRLGSLSVALGSGCDVLDVKNGDSLISQKWTPLEVYGYNEYRIPPRTLALAVIHEKLRMPSDTCGIIYGKSTYTRCGMLVLSSPIEPEWHGHLTIGLYNTQDSPMSVYQYEGIIQVQFHRTVDAPDVTYRDRQGKYQNQSYDLTLPRI